MSQSQTNRGSKKGRTGSMALQNSGVFYLTKRKNKNSRLLIFISWSSYSFSLASKKKFRWKISVLPLFQPLTHRIVAVFQPYAVLKDFYLQLLIVLDFSLTYSQWEENPWGKWIMVIYNNIDNYFLLSTILWQGKLYLLWCFTSP